jgi:hypothetical protein
MFHAYMDCFCKEVVFRPSVKRSLRFMEIKVSVSSDMLQYEALYGSNCKSPLYWDEVGKHKLLEP